MPFFTSVGLALGASAASAAAVGGLATVAVGATVVGTGVSVYGQMQQAQTAKKMGAYNAKLAENQALQTEMDSREQMRRTSIGNKRIMATHRVSYAKAGVDTAGTPLAVMAETAGNLKLSSLDYMKKTGQDVTALYGQAGASRALGAQQAQAAYIGAGASLLSGASSMASMGYGMKRDADMAKYYKTGVYPTK
jgi:hypothetical protein